jgi:hypothetical protein
MTRAHIVEIESIVVPDRGDHGRAIATELERALTPAGLWSQRLAKEVARAVHDAIQPPQTASGVEE